MTELTAREAQIYLEQRLQLVYDRLGGGSGRPQWNLQDATAVRALLRELDRIKRVH